MIVKISKRAMQEVSEWQLEEEQRQRDELLSGECTNDPEEYVAQLAMIGLSADEYRVAHEIHLALIAEIHELATNNKIARSLILHGTHPLTGIIETVEEYVDQVIALGPLSFEESMVFCYMVDIIRENARGMRL